MGADASPDQFLLQSAITFWSLFQSQHLEICVFSPKAAQENFLVISFVFLHIFVLIDHTDVVGELCELYDELENCPLYEMEW